MSPQLVGDFVERKNDMTLLMMFVVVLCVWFLGRAQLRAELADKEKAERELREATTGLNRRRYYR